MEKMIGEKFTRGLIIAFLSLLFWAPCQADIQFQYPYLAGFANSWLTDSNSLDFKSQFDFNADNTIDFSDFSVLASRWGYISSEVESNGDFTSANLTALGSLTFATIDHNGDQDYFWIDFPRSGLLILEVSNTKELDAEIYLYDANQQQIAHANYNGFGQGEALEIELPRDVDLQRIRIMIEEKKLSDREANFYQKSQ